MGSKVLIPPKTAADTSSSFGSSESGPVTISASGLAGAEEVDIYFRANPALAWAAVTDSSSGTAVVLSATILQVQVTGNGEYYVDKPITAGAVGVAISGDGVKE